MAELQQKLPCPRRVMKLYFSILVSAGFRKSPEKDDKMSWWLCRNHHALSQQCEVQSSRKTESHSVITFEPHTAKLCSSCKITIVFISLKCLCCDYLRYRYSVNKVAIFGHLCKQKRGTWKLLTQLLPLQKITYNIKKTNKKSQPTYPIVNAQDHI